MVALGKHYAAYGAAIGGLNGGPADVSNRTLHEVYLRPWMALGRAGVRAVMPSHNSVGDVPCHANHWMLQQKLRDADEGSYARTGTSHGGRNRLPDWERSDPFPGSQKRW